MTPRVRTVLGDVDPNVLGALDYHEHLFQVSPLLAGDELDDEQLSGEEAVLLHEAGMTAMVEATPIGLGRDPAGIARISARTGMTIVHVTGAHHGGHYAEGHPVLTLSEGRLADGFRAEVSEGMRAASGELYAAPGGQPVRAGMVKAGIRYWAIGAFEERVLAAAAATHVGTGCPVMVHLDYGSGAHEVLDRLAAGGVPAHSVVLAHMDRNLDAGLHLSLVERGAYLGYDGMARHREAPDSAILDCLTAVVEGGGVSRIVLGGDVARRSRYVAYGGMPGLAYLPRRFLPRLRMTVGEETTRTITVSNGAALLAF